MILSASVMDVHHGIFLLALLIIGWSIDEYRPPGLGVLGPVDHFTDLSVGNVLGLEEVHARLGDVYGAGHAAGAEIRLAGRVSHGDAVHDQGIIMVSGKEGLGDDCPGAGGVLDAVIAATKVDLHALRLGRAHLEHHGIVREDLRETVGAYIRDRRDRALQFRFQLLLCLCIACRVHEVHHLGEPRLHEEVDAVARALDEVKVGHDALLLNGLVQFHSLAMGDDVVLGSVEDYERRVGRVEISDGVDGAEKVVLAGVVNAEEGLLGGAAPRTLPLAFHVQQVDGTGPVADAVDRAAEGGVRAHRAFEVYIVLPYLGFLDI